MDDAAFIIGLMRTETAALGFIPSTAIRQRWIPKGRYIIQRDSRGRPRGYLLFGPPAPGRPLFINQACIDYDYRLLGFGFLAVRQLLERARAAGSSSIQLNCATDLPATHFWHACGFDSTRCRPGGRRRQRVVATFVRTVARVARPPALSVIGPLKPAG